MMRTLAPVIILAATAALVVGCSDKVPRTDEAAAGQAAEVIGVVEVTNEPLAFIVDRLAGTLVELRFRGAEAPDPAYWKPSTDDVLAMQRADLIVLNGASYESWLKDVSLPTSRLVDTTAAVRDRLISVADSVTHSHGPEGSHEHTGTAFTTWLDPTLLAEQARAVEAAFAARWPEHADLFAERLAALDAELTALDTEIAAAIEPLADRAVVFSHPVYQYLQRRYGLSGDSVHFEPDVMPDETQWMDLDGRLQDRPAAWMIWEAEPEAATRAALADRGCGVIVVSPAATPPADGDFLDVMRSNAAALRTAFTAVD